MYEARYWGILSPHTILHVQAGFIHVICQGISNKSVAVPRQDSIRPYRAHAVLPGYCNIYMHDTVCGKAELSKLKLCARVLT